MINIHYALLDKKDLKGSQQECDGPDGRGHKLVQRSLTRCWRNQTVGEYPRAHPVAKEGDRKLALLIVKDLRPLFDCNSLALASLIHTFDERYHMPCADTLRSNVLVPMWDVTKHAIMRILDPINNIALTTDAWTSIGEHSFITVTSHVMIPTLKCIHLH